MKNFLKLRILAVVIALTLALIPAGSVMAASTADVTVTATPEYLAMTNSENTWAIGAVAESTTVWWTVGDVAPDPEPFELSDMKSMVINTGSIASDVKIKGIDFTGGVGWTLDVDGTPGEDNVSMKWGIVGTANAAAMTYITKTDAIFISDLAASANQSWCMNLETSTFTDGEAKSGTITVTIFKHV